LQHIAPAKALVCATEDPDDYAAALFGGEFECTPHTGLRFAARLRVLRVADMLVQQGDSGAHSMRGTMGNGLSALLVPIHYGAAAARLNGAEVQENEAFLVPGGVEFRAHCPGPQSWAALAVPGYRMEAWLDLAKLPIRSPGEAAVLAIPSVANANLLRLLSAAAGMAEQPPEALTLPGCAENLAWSLGDAMLDVVASGARLLPTQRAAREAQRVVRMAEEYLHGHIDRPIYREQLCAALGVSLRKLHDAFIATTGLSPQTYLKVRRLTLVRRVLRETADRPTLVKSVALSHGFWHLGHFARDYRRLFCEAPSDTVARARSRDQRAIGWMRSAA
jgi:AraC-like DNA-binding protein